MKITIDFPENELREIIRLTGIQKKGPAIRHLLGEALTMRRREAMTAKFASGDWSAEASGYETARDADRKTATNLAEAWRD